MGEHIDPDHVDISRARLRECGEAFSALECSWLSDFEHLPEDAAEIVRSNGEDVTIADIQDPP